MSVSVILLAAGYGTRLWPLTKDRPKALLPLRYPPPDRGAGRGARGPVILDEIVGALHALPGVRRRLLVTNHRFAAQFRAWRKARGAPIRIVDDRTTTPEDKRGAIWDLRLAARAVPAQDDLLVVGTDNLFRWSLARFVKQAQAHRPAPSLALWKAPSLDDAGRFGVVQRDRSGHIRRFAEKTIPAISRDVAVCVYYLPAAARPRLGEFLRAGGPSDAPGYFFQWLVREGCPVYGVMMPGAWYDIGTPRAYAAILARWRRAGRRSGIVTRSKQRLEG